LNDALLTPPAGVPVITDTQPVDGLSYVDPDDPALPIYRLMAGFRSPLALRDMMIAPVRSGYVGDDDGAPGEAAPADAPGAPLPGDVAVPGVAVTEVFLPIDGGTARCQLYRPDQAPTGPLPLIVYFHGGGFMVGRSEDTDFVTRKLAATNGAVVLSANYRLAPEHPFPTPLDDAMGVYAWAAANAEQLGADGTRIAVAGDSAGSNFAAAIPLRARDDGLRVPDAVVMLGALADFRFERYASYRAQAPRGIVYDTAFVGFLRGAYLPTTDWSHPWASPIEGDLRGYPRTIVATGTHDPVIDSARAFAAAIEAAGGTVDGYWPEGMPHGFYFFAGVVPEEARAFEHVARALGELFG
jgi:acetyl esterase